MRNLEHSIQVALTDYVAYKHPKLYKSIAFFAIPNGGARSPATGAMLKAEGVHRGVFDLMVCVPRGMFHALFIELKAGKNKLTPEQKIFMESRIADNYSCVVCYSVNSAIEELEKYLAS
jgi:hypothetical protein